MEADSTKRPKQAQKPTKAPKTATSSVTEADVDRASRTGVIIGVVLSLAIVALVTFAGVWAYVYSNSAKIASDAMNKLFSAENVALDGSIALESTDRSSDLRELMIFFDSASTNLPNASHVAIRGAMRDGAEISVDIGTVQMQDGVMYLRLSGLVETLTEFGIDEDDLDWIYETIEMVDDEWWRIDMKEIATTLDLDSGDAKRLETLQACVAQEMSNDIRGELGDLYRSNDFIDLTKVDEVRFEDGSTYGKSFEGTDYYSVTPNYQKMAGFVNGLADINTMRRIYACVQDNFPGTDISAEDFDETTARELERLFTGNTTVEVFLEISKWGHELRHVVSRIATDDVTAIVNLSFLYESAMVNAPDNYHPITELIDEITDLVTEFYQELYGFDEYEIKDVPEQGIYFN